MDDADATWSPQSPDLSSHYSADDEPVHPQHQGYRGSISHTLPYSPPTSSPTLQAKALPLSDPMPRGARKEESMHDVDYVPDAPVMATEKTRGKKREDNGAPAATSQGAENVNITVHFPVARIKRIMQADDDVGKVAQVTPVVVSKALELFMISLVTKAAAEAKARNSKRVGAIHLKQAITNDEQFDFLSDIVSKVADAPAAEKSEDAMDVDGKKKKPSTRRKKTKNEDDDF
ncbi:hypothetical protein N0V90_007849 [Kalmusia sp. IMI 367209]|nr:hypothetical protein N0V90_007849 [Kalmusia sp. IMI 367209]